MATSNVIFLALALSCLASVAICSRRPNIVFIVADDLGWNDVSFHGSNQILTPNIDALAYNGVILNSHYVPALCTPSRASLLTGKYPTSIGMQHLVILAPEPWGLPLEETLMPEHFRRHGYATHAIGKWHLGFHKKEYTPTYRGFDTHFGYWNGYQDYYDHTMEDNTLAGATEPLKGYDMRRGLEVDYSARGEYSTDAFTNEAVNIIKSHNSTKGPLFLYIAHLSPHSGNPDKPFQAPDEEIAKHSHIEDPERRVYAAMVSKLDEGVGRVVSSLRESDLLDNTIIVFASDNGAVTFGVHSNRGSNYPLRGLKESPWEGGVRGVAAIWSPLLSQTRRVSNQLMHMSDWLPTLYSAAGLDTTELGNVDGVDLWDSLSNGKESPRTEVFNNFDEIEGYSSLRVGSWKYIEGTAQAGDVDQWYGESGEDAASLGYNVNRVLRSRTNIAVIGHLTDKQLEVYGKPDAMAAALLTQEDVTRLRREAVVVCDPPAVDGHRSPGGSNLTNESGSELKRRIIREIEEIRRQSLRTEANFVDLTSVEGLHDAIDVANAFACDPMKEVCVFNLERDPCERMNLARVFPDVTKSLRKRLEKLKETVAKPLNIPGDPFANPALHNGTWSNWRDRGAAPEDASQILAESVSSLLQRDSLALLLDNSILKVVLYPIMFVFDEFLTVDSKPATLAASALACAAVYALIRRVLYASESSTHRKGVKAFSISPPSIRRRSSQSLGR